MTKEYYLRKCFWILLGMLLVFSLSTHQASAADQYIRLGSGGPGGSWFQMAGGLSSLFNKKIENCSQHYSYKCYDSDKIKLNRLSNIKFNLGIDHYI